MTDSTTTTTTTTTTTHSPFLDVLPSELRLHIYSHLLVASTPLKGQLARQDKQYNLHTAILRTSKQIYHEARSIFFGRNTFYITSIPPTRRANNDVHSDDDEDDEEVEEVDDDEEKEEEGSGALEPPLQLSHLSLVRHLEIDLLYCPNSLQTTRDASTGIWKPVCVGAQRYSTSLAYLLSGVETSLLTLKLCADTRRYEANISSSSNKEEENNKLHLQRILTGFYMADANPLFHKALARVNVNVANMALRFDFVQQRRSLDVAVVVANKEVRRLQSLVELARHVLGCVRSDIYCEAGC